MPEKRGGMGKELRKKGKEGEMNRRERENVEKEGQPNQRKFAGVTSKNIFNLVHQVYRIRKTIFLHSVQYIAVAHSERIFLLATLMFFRYSYVYGALD